MLFLNTADYIPTRTEILASRGLKTVLDLQGKEIPADILREAAWDLDKAADSLIIR